MNDTASWQDTPTPLLDVRSLTVEFDRGRHCPPLRVIDGVDATVSAGETVGLVGESGSGKTTISRAILGLTPIAGGTVRFAGADITHANGRTRRRLSGQLQVVFQDPYSSLNPTRTIGQTLAETLSVHSRQSKAEIGGRVQEILTRLGLGPEAVGRYPAHFSGGQRQRIAIARALIVRPQLVICDEPVSSLDLSVQAQILNLLRALQNDLGLAYLFIAHDLAVVRHLSHRIVVLYRGQIMEQGKADTVYNKPTHPYTRALLAAAPVPDPEEQRRRRAARRPNGTDPTPVSSNACRFSPRCPHVIDICRTNRPQLETTPDGSRVACHRWRQLRLETPVTVDSIPDVMDTNQLI